jgi:mannose-6-phosphate isomerase-like protein (cupin superfamily)
MVTAFKYIHVAEETDLPFGGFGDDTVPGVPVEAGHSLVLVGPDALYAASHAGYFASERLTIGVHYYPPGRSHTPHEHATWEQVYYVISGTAKLTVGTEQRIVGPGGCSFTPPGTPHDVENVGDGELVCMVIGAVLDEPPEAPAP